MAKRIREFRWQLSKRQWAYLEWLANNTGLGRTGKDVAQFLLTQKIQEMRLGAYQEPQPEGTELQVTDDDEDATGSLGE
jgi:hypothetical protein